MVPFKTSRTQISATSVDFSLPITEKVNLGSVSGILLSLDLGKFKYK